MPERISEYELLANRMSRASEPVPIEPEQVSERELLAESIFLGLSGKPWAEFAASVLGRTAACPPTVKLIELGRGLLSPGEDAELRPHVQNCLYCAPWLQGFTHPAEGPRGAALEEMREVLAASWEESPSSEPLVPASSPTRVSPGTPWAPNASGSLAKSITSRIDRPNSLPALRGLLENVGLDPDQAEVFREFVLRKRRESASTSVAAKWPEWLEQYAREELPRGTLPCRLLPEEWDAILWRFALDCFENDPQIEEYVENEPRIRDYQLVAAFREILPSRPSQPLDEATVNRLVAWTGMKPREVRKNLRELERLFGNLN